MNEKEIVTKIVAEPEQLQKLISEYGFNVDRLSKYLELPTVSGRAIKLQTVKNMDNGRSLLQRCIKQGFSIASISMVTQMPEEEIQQFLDNDNYRLNDKEQENRLMVFLMLLCYEKPEDDKYYKMLLESLTQYFHVSPQAIANYIGISVDELLSFESSLKKDMIEKNIAHLFNAFVRDYRFS